MLPEEALEALPAPWGALEGLILGEGGEEDFGAAEWLRWLSRWLGDAEVELTPGDVLGVPGEGEEVVGVMEGTPGRGASPPPHAVRPRVVSIVRGKATALQDIDLIISME